MSTPNFEGRELTQQECYQAGYEQGKRDAVPEWINVEDRLPERYTEVMVWPYPSEQVMTAQFGLVRKESAPCWHYSTYESNWGWEERDCNPTHWMPLPAAPKQEK